MGRGREEKKVQKKGREVGEKERWRKGERQKEFLIKEFLKSH